MAGLFRRVGSAVRDVFSKTQKSTPSTRRADERLTIEYSPELDGEADPGEVVWTWVPFEDDPNQGKDRPVVVIGHVGKRLAVVPLTSKDKGRNEAIPVGSGSWDPQGRPSWAKVDRLLVVEPGDVRREGSILDRGHFDGVVEGVRRYHDVR